MTQGMVSLPDAGHYHSLPQASPQAFFLALHSPTFLLHWGDWEWTLPTITLIQLLESSPITTLTSPSQLHF